MNKIDIVIVNWNSGPQLYRCIDSIAEFSESHLVQTIVVDNGSVDGSEVCAEEAPGVKLLRVGTNLGFGRACNVGAKHATSDYILFLNPDAALYRDTLRKVVAYMRESANANVGVCGVQLLDESGQVSLSCSRFPSAWGFMAHAVGLDRVFPHLGHSMAEWDHSETRHVDQVIGAFFLVRRTTFEELNGFDERFFVYFEEVDFSYRAFQCGWSSVYLADAQAFHAGNGTTNQVKARRLFYSWRSRLLYTLKHFSRVGAITVFATTLLLEPLFRSGWAVFRRSRSGLNETWIAYGMLWVWLAQRLYK